MRTCFISPIPAPVRCGLALLQQRFVGQWRREDSFHPKIQPPWGDGDALPGGREEVRDAGMQDEWRGHWQYKKDLDK